MIYNKICKKEDCNNTFSTSNLRKLYCSEKCRNSVKQATYKKLHGRRSLTKYFFICKYCKSQFETIECDQKYCTHKCSSDARKRFIDIPTSLESGSRKLDKTLGYVRVYCPMHPEANTWGYVYEHRVVAEQIIGRRLIKDEVVHHKNGKRWDNRPENLEVMNKFEHGKLRGQRPEDMVL